MKSLNEKPKSYWIKEKIKELNSEYSDLCCILRSTETRIEKVHKEIAQVYEELKAIQIIDELEGK